MLSEARRPKKDLIEKYIGHVRELGHAPIVGDVEAVAKRL